MLLVFFFAKSRILVFDISHKRFLFLKNKSAREQTKHEAWEVMTEVDQSRALGQG